MPRKSNNKTSYVMNLITNGEEEPGQESQNAQNVQAAAQNTPAVQTPAPGAPQEAEMKKVVVVDEDQESERLSEEIRGQLELQLEAELKEQAEAEPGQPSQETAEQEPMETVNAATEAESAAPADTTANTEIVEPTMDTEMNTVTETETMDTAADVTAAAETIDTAADVTAAAETMDTAADVTAAAENTDTAADMEAAPEISTTTTQPTQPFQSGYRMVNVMETLVARVDLDKYIKEYGVCPCPRCRADVHALILTTLPSKYVVMDDNAVSLMLNFYESRRKTDIFTATLKACLEVKEHPRHEGKAEQ